MSSFAEEITQADVDELIGMVDRQREAWINGQSPMDAEPRLQRSKEDITLFGAFGGEATRGWSNVGPRTGSALKNFEGGTGSLDVIKSVIADDVVILVYVSRNELRRESSSEAVPYILRTTEVFRRSGNGWLVLHRHADPLIVMRSFEETLALSHPQ